jgi:hypothetical protein
VNMPMNERDSVIHTVEALQDQCRRLRYAVRYYDGEDQDWPASEPIPAELHEALRAAEDAIDTLETSIESAKRDYRIRCLEWLLAKERNG